MQCFLLPAHKNTIDIQKAFECRIFGLQKTRLNSWYLPEKIPKNKKTYDLCGFRWDEATSCKNFSKFIFTYVLVMTFWQLKLDMSVSGIRIFLNYNKTEGIFLSKIYIVFSTVTYQYKWVQMLQTERV